MIQIANVFREYGPSYRQTQALPLHILKAMNAIEVCRTSQLGGRMEKCEHCGHQKAYYNSCRNRHCPQCQNLAKEKWLIERKQDLLPVEYFHVVLTIPDTLNDIAIRNQKVIYDLLFKAGSESLLELSKDPKFLGAEIGIIMVLHTWGQNLVTHPHLHCIVTGGGLSPDGQQWISARKGFFVPVEVLGDLFRGKFLFYLKEAYRNKKLKFTGEILHLSKRVHFQKLLTTLYQKRWITFCKPSFHNNDQVFNYLGRYTHRVAISNNRIQKVENEKVTFHWRDYRDGNKNKLMTIEVFEFIRRFLLHILPPRFVKIRHYGILSNRNHQKKLKLCRRHLEVANDQQQPTAKNISWQDLFLRLTGIDLRICPVCGNGQMKTQETINPASKVSPKSLILLNRFVWFLTYHGNLAIESP